MPQMNILPIEKTQVIESSRVNGTGQSESSDGFGRHLAEHGRERRDSGNDSLRSSSAGKSGNRYNSSLNENSNRSRETEKVQERSHQASSDYNSDIYEKPPEYSDTRHQPEAKERIASELDDELREDEATVGSANDHVSPDVLLTVLGASEKTLIDNNETIKGTTDATNNGEGKSEKHLKGLDEQLKTLVSKIEKPANTTEAGYVSPIAALRRGEGDNIDGLANQKTQDISTKGTDIGASSKVASEQAKALDTKAQAISLVKAKEQLVGEQPIKSDATQDTENLELQTDGNDTTDELIAAQNKYQKIAQKAQEVVRTENQETKSIGMQSNSLVSEQETVEVEAQAIDDHAVELKPTSAADNKNSTEDNLAKTKQQPKDSAQFTQSVKVEQKIESVVEQQSEIEKGVDKAAQASLEKVGQSTNNATNHTRVINQSTLDAVKSSEENTDASSQEQSEQQSDAKEFMQKDARVNVKNNEGLSVSDKAAAEIGRVIDKASAQQGQQSVSNHSNDAIAVDKAIDRLSNEQSQTSANRQVTQAQNETLNVNRKDFVDNVKDKVLVMINKRLQQLEIRLDPAELGSMQVKLNMQNEQAAVNIVVQNSQAKEALDQNIQKLRDMLQESGVDVGDANIEHKEANEQQTFSDEKSSNQSGDLAKGHEEEQVVNGQDLYKASSTGVDYYA